MTTKTGAPFVLLLPPSEGKATGGDRRPPWRPESGLFGLHLGHWRAELAAELERTGGGDARLLGVKGDLLARARSANSSLLGAPTLPAWRRYTGVVWDHLDPGSLADTDRSRIWVVSGLAGLVSAVDPLPDYRLKMSARPAGTGPLAAWWRDDLTDPLLAYAKGRPIVDLLPQEHRAALNTDDIEVVRIDLVAKSGCKVGGHNAKAAKGLLARHLLTSRSGDVKRMVDSFSHNEYRARIV